MEESSCETSRKEEGSSNEVEETDSSESTDGADWGESGETTRRSGEDGGKDFLGVEVGVGSSEI